MTSPFLEVLETMIESRDDGIDAGDADDEDNNDLQTTGENCDAGGESSNDEDHANLMQCLTDVDFSDNENDSDDEHNTKEAKVLSVSGDPMLWLIRVMHIMRIKEMKVKSYSLHLKWTRCEFI